MRLHNLKYSEVAKVLTHDFNCTILPAKGTHYVFTRYVNYKLLRSVVPFKSVIQCGTLSGILRRLSIDRREFEDKL